MLEHQHSIATPVLAAALQGEVGTRVHSDRDACARPGSDPCETPACADDEIAALHRPTGLDLGARTPAESAVSIVAEIIASRAGRDATPLCAGTNTISV